MENSNSGVIFVGDISGYLILEKLEHEISSNFSRGVFASRTQESEEEKVAHSYWLQDNLFTLLKIF